MAVDAGLKAGSTRTSSVVHFHVRDIELFPADARRREVSAPGTSWIEVGHAKLVLAFRAALHTRHKLQFQGERLAISVLHQDIEPELQCIGIDARELSNLNPDLRDVRVRMARGLAINAVENGSGNSEFVHKLHVTRKHGGHGI